MTGPDAEGAPEVRFEATLARLESIVKDLERDDLPLDDALRLFEEGISHVRVATHSLDRAEARLGQLVEAVDGALSVTPIDA
jgi:exodeoxyribonuclease VII small subunit